MLLKIIGIIWLISGVFFFCFPERMRNYLKRKSLKMVRRILFMFTWIIAGLLFGAAWEQGGTLGMVLIILGGIALIKGTLLLKGQIAERMMAWFYKWPLWALRASAGVHMLIGLGLVIFAYMQ